MHSWSYFSGVLTLNYVLFKSPCHRYRHGFVGGKTRMKSFPDLVTAMPVSLLGDLDLQRVLSDFDIAAIAATFGSVSAVMKPFCDDLLKGKLAFFYETWALGPRATWASQRDIRLGC
jgi:hypothetical protein